MAVSLKATDVWSKNLESELAIINHLLKSFPVVAIDTEFPGFLCNTPRDALEEQRYSDLKHNVDCLKPIQLGFTLSDCNDNIAGVWQFNFCDFDLKGGDLHVPASVELLKTNGIDLEENKKSGINSHFFAMKFKQILAANQRIQWVTFHGLYDLAYLLKIVTQARLPSSILEFVTLIGGYLGRVYDTKHMAQCCPSLSGDNLGLSRLAKLLKVERCGQSHQAGSDSLVTALAFLKMKELYKVDERLHEGFLYGITAKIIKKPWIPSMPPPPLMQAPPMPRPMPPRIGPLYYRHRRLVRCNAYYLRPPMCPPYYPPAAYHVNLL
ncbi:hypothetical protein RJ639_031114 [Escallonia herrerae]|uniref:poly(A)-specific ribonuclease n=1 Tax=Escallonia herrerae TaxID=1293975 RepID=A0AA88X0P5_9ASTE|nr:hypothetical protein RJ639_031114 [Escallonia herrerae]